MGMKFLEWRFSQHSKNMKLYFSNINSWSENFVTLVTESNDTVWIKS